MKPQYITIDEDGDSFYFSDREMRIPHREDGPAMEYAGTKSWWVNGKRHREDGPAIEYKSGYKSWFLNDEQLSEAEHKRRTAKETILTMGDIAAKFGVDVFKLKIFIK